RSGTGSHRDPGLPNSNRSSRTEARTRRRKAGDKTPGQAVEIGRASPGSRKWRRQKWLRLKAKTVWIANTGGSLPVSLSRKVDAKNTPFRGAFNCNETVVLNHKFLHDREAEPHSLLFCCEKRSEDAREIVRRNPYTVVHNFHHGKLAGGRL